MVLKNIGRIYEAHALKQAVLEYPASVVPC